MLSICRVEKCGRDIYLNGFCKAHYTFSRRYSEIESLNHIVGKRKVPFDEKKYINKEFVYLTLIEFTNGSPKRRKCVAKCKCGNIKEYYFSNIKYGKTLSCGCKERIGKINNMSKHPLYNTYMNMINRCYNIKDKNYKNYGARGIKVCKRWLNNFTCFMSDVGDKPDKNYSIDRINNNNDYKPSNIRWATSITQMNNTRLSDLLTASKLSKLTGYSRERIRQLTYITTSSRNSNTTLEKFIDNDKSIITNKKKRYIYTDKAISFLLDNKKR